MIRRKKTKRTFNKKRIFSKFAVFMSLVVMATIFSVVAISSWEREEKIECFKWQKEARKIRGYFLAGWQKEQCDSLNIKINAPVKKGRQLYANAGR